MISPEYNSFISLQRIWDLTGEFGRLVSQRRRARSRIRLLTLDQIEFPRFFGFRSCILLKSGVGSRPDRGDFYLGTLAALS